MEALIDLEAKRAGTKTLDSERSGQQQSRKQNPTFRSVMKEIQQDFEIGLRNHNAIFEAKFKDVEDGIKAIMHEVRGLKRGVYERIVDPVCICYASSSTQLILSQEMRVIWEEIVSIFLLSTVYHYLN